jgi:predicted phage baseplate assembly protein
VQFGDGQTGARLPSGTENVVATYRSGLGRAGRVKAGQISLLLSRPLGLKEVTNPMRSAGGADPETVDELRENAPFTVLTLGRIVSLQDFADFARGFAGIAKAQAVWLWDGQSKIVHLTVAGADGETIEKTSDVYKNLLRAIDLARDPGCHVRVDSYQPGSFNVAAKALVQREFIPEKVRAAVAAAVVEGFSFGRRDFGQGVTKSELLAVMQRVDGVEAVDLDAFYLSTEPVALAERLPARTAQWNQTHTGIEPAELLLINSYGVKLSELKA